jgi:hypothetical protein
MEFKTKNYVTWDEYLESHPKIADVPAAKKIQDYEDQVFSLVMRLFR